MLYLSMELFLLLGVIVSKLIGQNIIALIAVVVLLFLSSRSIYRSVGDFWYEEEQSKIKLLQLCIRIFLVGLLLTQFFNFLVPSNMVLGAGVYCGYVVDAKTYYSRVRVYHTATQSYLLAPANQKMEGNLSGLLYTSIEFSVSENGKSVFLRKKECDKTVVYYFKFLRLGLSLKEQVGSLWEGVLGKDVSVLLLSILVGNRALPSEIKETVKSVGLLHVVAISGVNIAYLQLLIGAITRKLSRTVRETVDFFCLILLFMFVGEAISLFRAVITYCVIFCVAKFGLNKSGILVFTVSFVLLFLLVGDEWSGASALLTMGACFGIMVVANIAVKMAPKKVPNELITSLVVWLCVTPVQYLLFKEMSVIGLFVGILVSPLIEVVSMIGYVVFALSLIVPQLGNLLVLLPGFLVSVFLFAVRLFHEFLGGG